MSASHTAPPAELVFAPGAPFSWTRRWAATHRAERPPTRSTYRIEGAVQSTNELADALAFARDHHARLEVQWRRAA